MNRIRPLALILFQVCISTFVHAEQTDQETYTLFASGDVNLARWVPHSIVEKGAQWPLADVATLSQNADIALTNLECVLANGGYFNHKGENRPYLYRGRPEMLDVLHHGGFDIVTVANNHGMDYGGDALLEQIDILAAMNIASTGGGRNEATASAPTYVQVGDVILAFIGMEHHFPLYAATHDQPGIFHKKGTRAITKALYPIIQEARKHADLVIFTPHWGKNWTENVAKSRAFMARWLIDKGVDAILGHSSHHLHGIEIYKGHPIVYDMGSYLFDRVMQHRMRYSAGFILDFNKDGFTGLEIHPVRLRTNHTQKATPSDVHTVHKLINNLSKEIDPSIAYTQNGDVLRLDFESDRKSARQAAPEKLHRAGPTRPVPADIRNRDASVVVSTPPKWASDFNPVSMANGIRILGAQTTDAVWPAGAFVAKILLETPGPLASSWVGVVRGEQVDGDGSFTWVHPFADAGWTANLWKPGGLFVNQTLVRLPEIPEGDYKLSFAITRYNPAARRPSRHALQVTTPGGADQDNFIPIGEIKVTTKGIPSGPSGVAWPGLLPSNENFSQADFDKAVYGYPRTQNIIYSVVAGALVLLVIGLVIWYFINRRKNRRQNPHKNQRAKTQRK